MNEAAQDLETTPKYRWLAPFLIAFLIITIGDLWSKSAVFAHSHTVVIDGYPRAHATVDFPWWIEPAWNTGVAWSMFEDSPLFIAFLTALLVPALIFSYFKWYRNHHRAVDLAFGMVIGGAIANAYDRFMTHFDNDIYGVRDFLAFTIPIFDYRWPTFNIADAGISTGFVLLLIASFIQERRQAKANEETSTSTEKPQTPETDA